MDTGIEPTKENPVKEITTYTDSRDILAKARKQAEERNFDDIFIADIDAHHTETESWRRSSLISMTPSSANRPRKWFFTGPAHHLTD